MNKMFIIIKDEIISMIPAFIYFIIAFNLIVLTEKLMIKHDTSGYLSYMLATIGAFIVVKFLIIVNHIKIVNAFPHKPLLYNIIWKIFIYDIFLILFRIIEKVIDFYIRSENAAPIFPHLHQLFMTPSFWAVQIWLMLLFIVYIVAAEFVHALGKNKIKSLLLDDRE